MLMLGTLLLILALVCFILAMIPIPSRINLVALGLAFLTAALLVQGSRIIL